MKLMTLSLGYCRAIDNCCCLFVLFVCFLVLLFFFSPVILKHWCYMKFLHLTKYYIETEGLILHGHCIKMYALYSLHCLCLLFRNSLFRNSSVYNTMYSGKEEAYDDNLYRNNINISCSSKAIIFKATTSTKHLFF